MTSNARAELATCLVLSAVLTGCVRRAPLPPPPGPAAAACGVQRWDVKTASDPNVQNQVNPNNPAATTVHDLLARKKPAPWAVNLPRQVGFDVVGGKQAVEKTDWQINEVKLVKIKLEADRDIHLIVRDPDPKFSGRLLTIEFPDPTCNGAAASPFKAQMTAARQALITACGPPPKGYRSVTGSATITGVGFFDKGHGAPSTTELHPAFSFQGTCK